MIKLDDSIGFLINRAAFTMKRAFEHKLAAYDLTAPQWAVLTRLWEKDGQSLIAIGKNLYFDKATMSGIIDRLKKKALVTKVRDLMDRRLIKVCLTLEGSRLRNELPPHAIAVNQLATKGFDKNDVERLKTYLRMLWNNLAE